MTDVLPIIEKLAGSYSKAKLAVEVCSARVGTKCPEGKEEGKLCPVRRKYYVFPAFLSALLETKISDKKEFQEILEVSFVHTCVKMDSWSDAVVALGRSDRLLSLYSRHSSLVGVKTKTRPRILVGARMAPPTSNAKRSKEEGGC